MKTCVVQLGDEETGVCVQLQFVGGGGVAVLILLVELLLVGARLKIGLKYTFLFKSTAFGDFDSTVACC